MTNKIWRPLIINLMGVLISTSGVASLWPSSKVEITHTISRDGVSYARVTADSEVLREIVEAYYEWPGWGEDCPRTQWEWEVDWTWLIDPPEAVTFELDCGSNMAAYEAAIRAYR